MDQILRRAEVMIQPTFRDEGVLGCAEEAVLEQHGGSDMIAQQLEAAGVDFETDTRRRGLESLLSSIDAHFDQTDGTIKTVSFLEPELPSRALEFVAVMIRMNDFLLLTQEKVASSNESHWK
jgi:hypothetical protein